MQTWKKPSGPLWLARQFRPTPSPEKLAVEFGQWARTKPPEEEYCYISNHDCAFAQFLRASGWGPVSSVGGGTWGLGHRIDKRLRFPLVAGTFGALVTRIERVGL